MGNRDEGGGFASSSDADWGDSAAEMKYDVWSVLYRLWACLAFRQRNHGIPLRQIDPCAGFVFRNRAARRVASVPGRPKIMIGFGFVSRMLNLDWMIESGNGFYKLWAEQRSRHQPLKKNEPDDAGESCFSHHRSR